MGPRKMLEISLPSFTLVRLNYSVSVTMKTNLEGILRICTYYSIMSMMRIAIVSPYAGSIVSFRGSLIEALVKRGLEVYVLAPDYSLDVKDAVKNLGAQPVDYFLKRTSMNPFLERKALRSLKKVLCAVKPDVTLGYMHKGAMYSVLASKNTVHCSFMHVTESNIGFHSTEYLFERTQCFPFKEWVHTSSL